MIQDRITNGIATGAAFSMAWMPTFPDALQILLTLLGIIWLATQIYFKWFKGQ